MKGQQSASGFSGLLVEKGMSESNTVAIQLFIKIHQLTHER
jgi:hypothetical protein